VRCDRDAICHCSPLPLPPSGRGQLFYNQDSRRAEGERHAPRPSWHHGNHGVQEEPGSPPPTAPPLACHHDHAPLQLVRPQYPSPVPGTLPAGLPSWGHYVFALEADTWGKVCEVLQQPRAGVWELTAMTGEGKQYRSLGALAAAGIILDPGESTFVELATLRADDLVRLQPGAWLNDNVIAAFLHQVTRRALRHGHDSFIFSSFIWTQYLSTGFSAVQRWLPTKGKPLLQRRFIAIPMNSRVSSHYHATASVVTS
jgi:hypothetical protein